MQSQNSCAPSDGAPSEKAANRSLALAALGAGSFTMVVWGATPMATKIAVESLDPFLVGMARTALGAIVCFVLALALRLPLPEDRSGWFLLLSSALSGFVAFPMLFSWGQSLTSTAHAGLIIAITPVFTGVFGAIAERRLPAPLWWPGAGIAFTGVAVLVLRHDAEGEATLTGDVICLAAVSLVAVGYVTGSRLAARIGTWPVTLWGIAFAGVLVALPLGLALVQEWEQVGTLPGDARAWAAILWLAIVTSLMGYAAWYWALDKGGVGRIGPLQFGLPLVTFALAVTFMDETLNATIFGATAMILLGIWLARKERFSKKGAPL